MQGVGGGRQRLAGGRQRLAGGRHDRRWAGRAGRTAPEEARCRKASGERGLGAAERPRRRCRGDLPDLPLARSASAKHRRHAASLLGPPAKTVAPQQANEAVRPRGQLFPNPKGKGPTRLEPSSPPSSCSDATAERVQPPWATFVRTTGQPLFLLDPFLDPFCVLC